jgi:signal transduction histidine kinase
VKRKQGAGNAASEGHFLVLAAHIDQGVAISRAGRVRWASARFARELGASNPTELVGRSMDSLIRDAGGTLPPADDAEAAICRVQTAKRDREIEIARIGATPSNSGDDSPEELWLLRELPPSGDSETERLQISRALVDAKHEVAQLREQLSGGISEREQLLGMVGHELRTPVTVIRGYNNLLLSGHAGPLSEQQCEFVEESNRSCDRLNRFIGDLLNSCGELREGLAVEFESGSLDPLIRGVLAFVRPMLEERGLSVDVDLDPTALWARFDPSRIEQVLTNLLGNAIRYSKAQSQVRVSSRPLDAAGRSLVEISVSDSGPGVAPEDRTRIFEPYVRVDGVRRAGGLGLGLAICRRIVEAHGGSIGVSEESGSGSRFWFTLEALAPDDGA